MKRVQVVAAVVRRGGRILVTRRPPGGPLGGLWEFPGGKVEAGETEPEALRREIVEELGCDVAVGRLLFRHSHDYPHIHVDLAFYACEMDDAAEPRCLGVAELAWAEPDRLSAFAFCPADVAVLERVAREG
ncbi:MAG TPA: (deoxy)nucleoside triphosphate pyrophosphohydrolase [Anaeromyxobacteraceae bacterium]|nr:(deoxy)nucleoside triphosphate pyrophosphohydrolase [Anaeromyxobacteraceae bacterium]